MPSMPPPPEEPAPSPGTPTDPKDRHRSDALEAEWAALEAMLPESSAKPSRPQERVAKEPPEPLPRESAD